VAQGRVEEAHVTGVGDHARVQQWIVGQLSVGLDPDLLARLFAASWTPRDFADEALVDGVLALGPFIDGAELVLNSFVESSDGFGSRNVGISNWCSILTSSV